MVDVTIVMIIYHQPFDEPPPYELPLPYELEPPELQPVILKFKNLIKNRN